MSDIETLRELNRNYVRAAQDYDARWYAENLSDDYVAINPDGSIADRTRFLSFFATPGAKRDYEAVDTNIRILGEVALIHSGFVDRKADGSVGRGRYTDIWARRDGRWLCVAAHFMRY